MRNLTRAAAGADLGVCVRGRAHGVGDGIISAEDLKKGAA